MARRVAPSLSHDGAPLARLLHHPEGRAVWDDLVVPRLGRAGLAALALCGRAGRAERDKRREAGERLTPLSLREVFEEPELLPWAEEVLGLRVNLRTAYTPAKYGYLEALQWLCAEGRLQWLLQEAFLCHRAAEGGHVHVLEWLRERGAPWGDTCYWAAARGQLDTLKWARERGAPWYGSPCRSAARNGHLETLQWLVANGCPINRQDCIMLARGNDQTATAQWLEQLA